MLEGIKVSIQLYSFRKNTGGLFDTLVCSGSILRQRLSSDWQPCLASMKQEYDCIVLGTGLKECIIAGMLSMLGKKVLHMDGNASHFGGESASLTPLESVFAMFGHSPPGSDYGRGKDWKIDLIPKFLLAEGHLLKLLTLTRVTEKIRYKSLEGHYYYKGGKISRLPADVY